MLLLPQLRGSHLVSSSVQAAELPQPWLQLQSGARTMKKTPRNPVLGGASTDVTEKSCHICQ